MWVMMPNSEAIQNEINKHASFPPEHTPFSGHIENLYEDCLLRPGIFVELGVFNVGPVSTSAFLAAAIETDSVLFSCDIEPCEHTRQYVKKHFDIADDGGLWTFHQGDSVQFGKDWPRSWQVNVLLIDTAHTAKQTQKELEVWLPLLAPNGVAFCHDTVSHPEGVRVPIEEYAATHPWFEWENREDSHGLGVIWRK